MFRRCLVPREKARKTAAMYRETRNRRRPNDGRKASGEETKGEMVGLYIIVCSGEEQRRRKEAELGGEPGTGASPGYVHTYPPPITHPPLTVLGIRQKALTVFVIHQPRLSMPFGVCYSHCGTLCTPPVTVCE